MSYVMNNEYASYHHDGQVRLKAVMSWSTTICLSLY